MNTNAASADIKRKFWRNTAANANTSAKNAEALRCGNCSQAFLSVRPISPILPVQQVLVHVPEWNDGDLIMMRTICHIGNNGAAHKHSVSISIVQCVRLSFQRLLRFTSRTLEYCFGMYIGGLLGWLGGWYTGKIYVEYFEPVYLSEFSGLDEIMCWERVPHIFAGAGVFAGVVIATIVTFCLSRKASDNRSCDSCT